MKAPYTLWLVWVMLAVVVAVLPMSSTGAKQPDDSLIRIFVELKDYRRPVRDLQARLLTSRAPRQYTAAGTRRAARDLRRWQVVEVPASQAESTLEILAHDPNIKSVHFEHMYWSARVPNDPQFSSQYGLQSVGGIADIKAPAAWDVTTGSSATVIAILDGGVDINHEDLREKVWKNSDEIAGNGIDDDANGYIDDVSGWDFVARGGQPAGIAYIDHATHIAGIAAASTNNGIGVAGVDWNARIMSVRVLSGSGIGGEENIIRGIEYAVANGADIINLSIVGSGSPALADAIENAYAAGVVVVAAAGNNGADTALLRPYPACADTDVNLVLGVAATDENGEPASFSNYGNCVDIAAPGDDIVSTKTDNRYGKMKGTSMSTPFAAGVAGLYLALYPNASAAQVISALKTGDPFTGTKADQWNTDYKGRLNAAKVVGVSVPSPGPLPTPTPTATSSPTPVPASQDGSGGSSGSDRGDGGDGGGGGGGDGRDGDPGPDPPSPEVLVDKPRAGAGRVAGVLTVKANTVLVPRINAAFRSVFGRNPNTIEHGYWLGRVQRGEKRTYEALQGAMAWQKMQGRTYDPTASTSPISPARVAGTASGNLVSRINALFRQAYGRNPTVSEHAYWLGRVVRKEKTTESDLLGAMSWQRQAGLVR